MKLKPLLIYKLLDCFERKYNPRLSRGGSWGSTATTSRAGYRARRGPADRYYDLGFRLSKQANEFKTTSNLQTARLL
jgi:hypothetical protein